MGGTPVSRGGTIALLILALTTAAVPFGSSTGGNEIEAAIDIVEDSSCVEGPTSVVDTCSHEPGNNVCSGAIPWPLATTGRSTGKLSANDPADWSKIELYRTEILKADVSGGASPVRQATSCDPNVLPIEVASVVAETNGDYRVQVPSLADSAGASYLVSYELAANDANLGRDASNLAESAEPINALPASVDPQNVIQYHGSIPNRPDQPLRADSDWYRINANLAPLTTIDAQMPAVGLLAVKAQIDCNGGTYLFEIYEADGMTRVGNPRSACGGWVTHSCVATGLTAPLARVAVVSGTGTGYDFAADLSPLSLVRLDDGVPRTFLNPQEPWCESIVPRVLGLVNIPIGLVNADGQVVASLRDS